MWALQERFDMSLRSALLAAFGALAVFVVPLAANASRRPVLAPEDQALVDKASSYLEGLNSAEGRFVQTDARGLTTQGTFYLKRPGRVRFEYDPPATMLIVSDGHYVTVYDQRLKTRNAYPLMFTPLHLFLAKTIRLDQGVVVDRVDRTPDGFDLTAHDRGHPNQGSITLAFAESPMQLKAWTVTDGRGAKTRVELASLKPATGLSSKLFTISAAPAGQQR
jgi:outer membrane lipoprotein-sorting protein